MKLLADWLNARQIEVVGERLLPDGGRRLTLKLPDGKLREVSLDRQTLLGKRADAEAFIEQLLIDVAKPRRSSSSSR